MKPLEAVGYDRVSTNNQVTKGVMLEARSESIPNYCQFRGWPVVEYFTDPGRSGRQGVKRPGFDAAMRAACRPGRVLVVDSLSRFVRSTIDAAKALKLIQDAGAELVIVNLGIDTTTASGKLIYTIIAAVAEFESDQLGERTNAARDFLRKKLGFNPMCKSPYGWRYEDGKRLPIESEQAVIALAWRLRLDRTVGPPVSFEVVAAKMDEMGLRTRKGSVWHPGAVRRILLGNACPAEVKPS
jgi:site-specific DNA recombinase